MRPAVRHLPAATSAEDYRLEVDRALRWARRAKAQVRVDIAAAEVQWAAVLVGELARERQRLGGSALEVAALARAVVEAADALGRAGAAAYDA